MDTEKVTPAAIEVKIQGQRIALKASGSDPEVVREVLSLVSERLRDAEKRGKGAASHQIVLLALLDVAEEYVRAKRRTIDLQGQMERKASQLLSLLETELK